MGRIQLLDDTLINKIAAGEVVERPASVVKELVENSLDAGATRITVELTEGGRKRILISDNGSGMDRGDALLALQRHATSKIRSDEDLFNLGTMGFRGEALASIASVAKLTLMTCEQGKAEGVRVVCEGGNAPEVSTWQSQGGTTLIIDDLFFNVPVRAKFLKTASTEYGNVLELMQSLALAWPQVDFTLVHNGREQLRAPAVTNAARMAQTGGKISEETLRQRFAQIFKNDSKQPMVYTACDGTYGQMEALLSAPGVEKATSRDIYMFVNGRFIKDKSLRYSVLRGYHSHLLKGKFPVAVLFLTMDPGLVDVNVHPSKTEVRLQYASELQGMVAMAIRDAIRKAEWSAPTTAPYSGSAAEEAKETSWQHAPHTSASAEARTEHGSWFSGGRPVATAAAFASRQTSFEGPRSPIRRDFSESTGPSEPAVSSSVAQSSPSFFASEFAGTAPLTDAVPWSELSYMGSVADCYLLFNHGQRRTGSRLLAVDQHAFHERILYERLCNKADELRRSQRLLVPEVLSFKPHEVAALLENKEVMERNGFALEFVDETTIEVKAVPLILVKADPEALMRAFIRRADSELPLETNVGLAHDILATMACHGAVRAGEALGENELKALIREAEGVDFFHNCPHGRRVFRWWDEQSIARWFDR